MWGLENRVVVVTGGAKGIGRAYVEAFAEAGARVVIADVDREGAEKLAAGMPRHGDRLLPLKADVADFADCRALAGEAWARWQGLDVLVNNAAVYSSLSRKPFEEIDGEEWDQVMAVNLKGLFYCAKAVVPFMKRQKYGKIINISSSTIFKGSPYFLHYVTSKAGAVGFTRALAREVGEFGIRVNAVAPGLTATGDNEQVSPPERFNKAIAERCLKSQETPRDLLGAILFLASGHSDFITGQLINVDGGACMY